MDHFLFLFFWGSDYDTRWKSLFPIMISWLDFLSRILHVVTLQVKKNVGSYLNNNLWSTWGKFLRPNLRNLSYRRIILEIIFICRLLKLQLIPDYIQLFDQILWKKFFPVKMFNHACQCPTGRSYFLIFLLPSLNITNF